MKLMQKIKHLISLDNPFRLQYHKLRAIIANYQYGFPSKDMLIIGVTGTNGKTTTCNIIAKWLQAQGHKVFMFTTVNVIIDDEECTNETKLTSPDAMHLQRLLAEAKKKWCTHAVIETASHGIKMHRIWGLEYDIAVLTNITQDHLDLHKTMDDYVATKLRLFSTLIGKKRKKWVKKTAIINSDSDYTQMFQAETYDSMYLYGNTGNSHLVAKNISNTLDGMRFDVQAAGKDLHIESSLRGDFNIYNILAAIGVFVSLGIAKNDIEKAIAEVKTVPGRMEKVDNDQGLQIYVDYAHTPDAIEKVLENMAKVPERGRIITVFWATWDRDKTKRPIMGEVVSRLSDVVILTQDDDYTENTGAIIKDVLPGIERKEGEDFWVIPDRREAIRNALIIAKKGDILMILGKGDEHVMVTNEGNIPWHDVSVVRDVLQDIDNNKRLK